MAEMAILVVVGRKTDPTCGYSSRNLSKSRRRQRRRRSVDADDGQRMRRRGSDSPKAILMNDPV